MHFYVDVPPAAARPEQRLAADQARRAVRADLGLDEPEVRFFAPALPSVPGAWWSDQPHLVGLWREGQPGVIRLRAGMSFAQTRAVALHECRHRFQGLVNGPWSEPRLREIDAEQYATELSAWLAELEGAR